MIKKVCILLKYGRGLIEIRAELKNLDFILPRTSPSTFRLAFLVLLTSSLHESFFVAQVHFAGSEHFGNVHKLIRC